MKLIIFSGLPGAGKSILADYASRRLALPIFAKDWVEAILWQNNVKSEMNSGAIAYDMLTSLAREQLSRSVSVIIDSVTTTQSIRDTWRALAQECGAEFVVVECICSNEAVHKSRLSVRKRNIDGWPELSWDDVQKVQKNYVPWNEKRLTLDSVDAFEKNAKKMISYLTKR